ncbi:response regulator transcription factor [uncultured Parabacteroides sp.]|uniref:LytR/AlgR family response regulator transcription factor n=1 Tax=uncultured Parabacteroides sp. TaxID=512312 RepID=UPI0026150795|nr:response regulator transcription factor [uncultured Parabacteroides sp.]
MGREITVIIVDDDLKSIQKLQDDLSAFPGIKILESAVTAELGKKLIIKYKPDLVFLDVELPDMSGFELLNDIREDVHPDLRVIFFTAYDKYVLDALRASAFDYLLKPYTLEELATMIKRFHTVEPKNILSMEKSLRKILNKDNRIAIQTVSGLLLVRREEIFIFQFLKDLRCWQIVLTSRKTHKLKMSTTAKELLSINNIFSQISQDCIVNLSYLMFIENKTLRCVFYPPFEDVAKFASHRYFKQLREKLDII